MGRAEDLYEQLVNDGESAIDEMIGRRTTEELFLDFKRSTGNGAGTRLNPRDRENLAKAISGFGNSEGGVIVWGVDCSPDDFGADVARAKQPIQDPARFKAWLEATVGGCTLPPHAAVKHHLIDAAGNAGHGFVVTLVPQSDSAPHQIAGEYRYMMRAGSNFSPVPHGLLAGMFGRAPRARLLHQYTVSRAVVKNRTVYVELGVAVVNAGPGIARDVFANVELKSPGENCGFSVAPGNDKVWSRAMEIRNLHGFIVHEAVRMPPETMLHPMTLGISIAAPIRTPLQVVGLIGGTNAAPHRFELVAAAGQLQLHEEFLGAPGVHQGDAAVIVAKNLLGLDEL